MAGKKLRYLIGANNPELALMKTRITEIQHRLNEIESGLVAEDGVLGPKTIEAIFNVLDNVEVVKDHEPVRSKHTTC